MKNELYELWFCAKLIYMTFLVLEFYSMVSKRLEKIDILIFKANIPNKK